MFLHAVLVLAAGAMAAGAGCPAPGGSVPGPLPAGFVDIEVVNEAFDPVDPGLFVDGFELVFDPPLFPVEAFVFATDCFAGTVLETDATLLTDLGPVASFNTTFLVEGVDFLCGDIVSFIFVEDATGFFTLVEVNGVPLAP